MSRALAYRTAGADLDQATTQISACVSRQSAWEDALNATGATGAAVAGGLAALARTRPPVDRTAGELAAVADILAQAASLQEYLDQAIEEMKARILSLLPAAAEAPVTAWLVARLAQIAGALGEVIDAQCAQAVLSVCTPAARPPWRGLHLADGATLAAIEESNLSAHPEYAGLVAADDLTLLEAGPDGVAVAVGELDQAEDVITFVAGVGSSGQEGWPGKIDNARALSRSTGAATVVWLNYSAPGGLAAGLDRAPARAGGARLREFQSALAQRNPGQRRVVLGYSYGSVVAAEAAREPLHADEVVLLGSPGVPLGGADEFQLTGTGGVRGKDPTAPSFGARRWPTGTGGHSSCFEDERTLDSLRAIVEGNKREPG